jgi:hypothetical protein
MLRVLFSKLYRAWIAARSAFPLETGKGGDS